MANDSLGEPFGQADIDNNGSIDYGEFIAATVHMNKLEREENLISAFSFFDKDSSGYITIDELQQACREFGLSDVHLDEMIREIDQNNVSFLLPCEEFHAYFLSLSKQHKVCLSLTNRVFKCFLCFSPEKMLGLRKSPPPSLSL